MLCGRLYYEVVDSTMQRLLQLPSTLLSSPSISLFGSCINTLFSFSAFFDLGYSLFGDEDLRTGKHCPFNKVDSPVWGHCCSLLDILSPSHRHLNRGKSWFIAECCLEGQCENINSSFVDRMPGDPYKDRFKRIGSCRLSVWCYLHGC